MLIVTGIVEVAEEGVEKASVAAQKMVAETLKEPGCMIYEFSQVLGHATRFRVYEEWQDQTALEAPLRPRIWPRFRLNCVRSA